MAAQPSRPWFRLATMARPPPPPPQQPDPAPPPPRPAFVRPAFTQAVTRPPNAAAPASPPLAKATPSPTVSKASMAAPAMTRVPTPTSLPVAKATPLPTVSKASSVSTPPPTISQPPSPLVLPPPQPEYEQKSVIMQDTKEKPKVLDNGRRVGWGNHNPKGKNSLDSDDVGMRIITIAGENKGAIMDMTPFSQKNDNPTPSSDSESNSEGKMKKKLKSPLMRAIMNSNVQGVNNSILYNSSTNHHDPGVHLSLSRKPNSGTK